MIRVLMLDFGETLVHGDEALPHAREALLAIAQMMTADGTPLRSCLVSDFLSPSPPVTPEKIAAIFDDYLSRLDGFGLREFFEPVDQRVTLSAQAGVRKPDRKIFEKALERLGTNAGLPECLFITEEVAHLQKAETEFGMKTIRFGSPEGITDWSEGPLAIAAKLAAPAPENVAIAAKSWLQMARGLVATRIEAHPGTNLLGAWVTDWCALPAAELGGEALHVQLPRPVELRLDGMGRVAQVKFGAPAQGAVEEAVQFVKTLRANRQLGASPQESPPHATHRIVVDSRGRQLLKRQRFSAV